MQATRYIPPAIFSMQRSGPAVDEELLRRLDPDRVKAVTLLAWLLSRAEQRAAASGGSGPAARGMPDRTAPTITRVCDTGFRVG